MSTCTAPGAKPSISPAASCSTSALAVMIEITTSHCAASSAGVAHQAAPSAKSAAADTAFWSFYFGLAAVASGVALWLALALRRRLLWGICFFSLNYPLVAALHGFPEWFFGHAALPFQDFMISSLSLFSYATALWLHSEIFDLKKNMPRLYRLLIAAGSEAVSALLTNIGLTDVSDTPVRPFRRLKAPIAPARCSASKTAAPRAP